MRPPVLARATRLGGWVCKNPERLRDPVWKLVLLVSICVSSSHAGLPKRVPCVTKYVLCGQLVTSLSQFFLGLGLGGRFS